jgi:NAD-dependent deacetylase
MSQASSELAARIRAARRLTVLTGAGVSAASGVPTFRGAEGLWKQYRPEDLATREAYSNDPALVWSWYAWRRAVIASCRPNAAHETIAAWSAGSDARRTVVITQNVDDLHARAGTPNVIRLHGSIWELSCLAPCREGAAPWPEDRVPLAAVPLCPHCGGVARPAVVWFGESLDPQRVSAALEATACDVFLTVGTSSVVYPAAGLVDRASARGAFTAEVNLEATPASARVDLSIQGRAEEILPLVHV